MINDISTPSIFDEALGGTMTIARGSLGKAADSFLDALVVHTWLFAHPCAARISTCPDGCKQCVLATGAFQSECGPISPPARRKTQPDTNRFGFFPVVGALASSDVGYTAQ